jgi:hypothetical protein
MKIKFREISVRSGDYHVLLEAYNENGDHEYEIFNRTLPFQNFRRGRLIKKLKRKMEQLYS